MRKAAIARRERNRELAKLEASKRCAFCKVPLPAHPIQRHGDSRTYCSFDCSEDQRAVEDMMHELRNRKVSLP